MLRLPSVLRRVQSLSCDKLLRGLAAVACATAALGAATAAAQNYDDLVNKIPRTANAIMAVDVEGLHNSPIGKAKNWANKHEENYTSRPFILPPEAKYAIVGAMFDPGTKESVWELGVMGLASELPARAIARSEGGYVDSVNETEAAWVPSNAYFVNLANKTLGVMYPAHRQALARWIDFTRSSKEGELSPYLRAAASVIEGGGSQVVLAIDLKNMVRPHELKRKLQESPSLKGKKVDLDALGRAITTLQGATMTISLRDKAYGRLQIDFGGDIHVVTPVAKQLILEVLDDMGAHLDELKNWSLETSGGSLSLNGEFTESGLRRIGSLLELPSVDIKDSDKPAPDTPTAEASKKYYNSVQTLVDDLRKTLRDERDNHAVWMEKFARKIDRLPILNVDPELLAFGAQSAERLRQSAVAKRSGLIRAGVRKSEVYGNYYDYGDGYYGNYVSAENQKSSIQLAENAQASKVRIDQWKLIEDDMAQLRQKMTKKYGVEF